MKHNKLKFFMYAALVIFLFPPISVMAGHDDEEIPRHLQKKYDRRLEEMKVLDTNGDGVLQAEELKKKSKMSFGAADTDKDGILSRKEIEAAQESAREKSKKNMALKTRQTAML